MGRTVLLIALLCLFASVPAMADMYYFTPVTGNSPLRWAIAPQLSLEVTGYGASQVLFTFRNNSGPVTVPQSTLGSITDVYFDDGILGAIAGIVEGGGVDFGYPATPSNLPGGGNLTPPFVTTDSFSADSESPAVANGVNPGESVGIIFDLQSGTLADVLAAMQLGFTDPKADGSLRVGIHVQAIGGSGGLSDSFIAIPTPAAVFLGMLGLGAAGLKLRKSV